MFESGKTLCSWCLAVLRDGDPAEPAELGVCDGCRERLAVSAPDDFDNPSGKPNESADGAVGRFALTNIAGEAEP